MTTKHPPNLYINPPSFDIELDEFQTLPLCRLEAFQLLRSGREVTRSSANSPENRSEDAATLLFLDGAEDSPSAARNHRVDVASHFILRLACCGRVGRPGDGGDDRPEGEEEASAEALRANREWFIRRERDLFQARLLRYLEHGEHGARSEWKFKSQGEMDPRLEALRLVYELGWLKPTSRRNLGHRLRREELASEDSNQLRCCAGDKTFGGAKRIGNEERVITHFAPGDGSYPRGRAGYASAQQIEPRARTVEGSCVRERINRSISNSPDPFLYTCPFEKVLPLVRSRRVLIHGGQAFLTRWQVPAAVVQHFERMLRDSLDIFARALPGMEEDERVRDLLRQTRKAVTGIVRHEGFGSIVGSTETYRSSLTITCSNIYQVAERHFPLCMRRMLRVLRREHHLKYQARLQLIIFLANAGMEVQEVLKLWRAEFPRGMTPSEYAKKSQRYEYSVRHLFGLEGKRKVHSPQSCSRIFALGWGSGEGGLGHGCPFKSTARAHWHPRVPTESGVPVKNGDKANGMDHGHEGYSLPGMLAEQGLPAEDIEDIISPYGGGSACGASVGSACGGGGGGAAVSACRRHFVASTRSARGDSAGIRQGWGGSGQDAFPNQWLAISTRLQPEEYMTQDE